jgi:aryl-alcohol dehydrogenase-like predicted oxidoreductase
MTWSPYKAAEVYAMFRAGIDTLDLAHHYRVHESEIVRGIEAHREYVRRNQHYDRDAG